MLSETAYKFYRHEISSMQKALLNACCKIKKKHLIKLYLKEKEIINN